MRDGRPGALPDPRPCQSEPLGARAHPAIGSPYGTAQAMSRWRAREQNRLIGRPPTITWKLSTAARRVGPGAQQHPGGRVVEHQRVLLDADADQLPAEDLGGEQPVVAEADQAAAGHQRDAATDAATAPPARACWNRPQTGDLRQRPLMTIVRRVHTERISREQSRKPAGPDTIFSSTSTRRADGA